MRFLAATFVSLTMFLAPASAEGMQEKAITALTAVYVGATNCDTNFSRSDAVEASKMFVPLASSGFREQANQNVQEALAEWDKWTEIEQEEFCASIPAIAAFLQIVVSPWSISDTVDLAEVVAAEDFCGLAFNEDAIFEYIQQNVPSDLADFASAFENHQIYTRNRLDGLNALEKRVRCMQTERLATLWGFLE